MNDLDGNYTAEITTCIAEKSSMRTTLVVSELICAQCYRYARLDARRVGPPPGYVFRIVHPSDLYDSNFRSSGTGA
jgi:hypothetical protein